MVRKKVPAPEKKIKRAAHPGGEALGVCKRQPASTAEKKNKGRGHPIFSITKKGKACNEEVKKKALPILVIGKKTTGITGKTHAARQGKRRHMPFSSWKGKKKKHGERYHCSSKLQLLEKSS